MPSNASARVNATTSNSSIDSEFGLATEFHGDKEKKNHLIGTIGSGGPALDLTTRNGRIRILKSSSSDVN
jgi:hypothetical protein